MNSRIQVLESGATHSAGPSSSAGGMLPSSLSAGPAHGPAGSSPFAGPAHGPTGVAPDDDVTAARSEGITFPRRTLGTAVPIATGVPFFPPAAAVSPHLRSQILAGNDVNLIKILLCSEISDRRIVDCGDVSVILKESDPRLSKTLTLAEFNVAFGVYRDTICEVYPSRRAALDTYLAIISDLALSYGGTLFFRIS